MKIKIRENITPRGDGNLGTFKEFFGTKVEVLIRENITPRGDGNPIFNFSIVFF